MYFSGNIEQLFFLLIPKTDTENMVYSGLVIGSLKIIRHHFNQSWTNDDLSIES